MACDRRRPAPVEPGQRQLEDRLRLAQGVEGAAHAGDVVGGLAMDQRRQVRELDGMDARQDLAELARDHRPRLS